LWDDLLSRKQKQKEKGKRSYRKREGFEEKGARALGFKVESSMQARQERIRKDAAKRKKSI
jgi:hypothetical protein